MNRYPSEQLMTVEEAERLSRLHPGLHGDERIVRRRIWAWQSVSGALSQCVSEEQLDRMMHLVHAK